jgi:protein-tyrosine phosphatase
MPSVLFICTANQFRSPLAAACFQHKYQSLGWQSDWWVSSAGTWTQPGNLALPSALQAAHRLGFSLANHRSRPLTAAMVSVQDLILVMESGHKEAIQAEFSIFRNRVFLLSEVVDDRREDIPDPVLHPDVPPFEVASQVCDMVERGFYRICARAIKSGVVLQRAALPGYLTDARY